MRWISREIHNKNNDGEKTYPFAQWISWLFLVTSLLLLIYTYYRSEITYNGTLHYAYFKYYVISLAGILFWGIVLRLREGARANIVTVVIALVVGLYMVEGGLTLLGMGQRYHAASAELGVEYDERSKLKVIEDLIAEGIDAVPTFHPMDIVNGVNESVFANLLPLAGVSNKTTVLTSHNYIYIIIFNDSWIK